MQNFRVNLVDDPETVVMASDAVEWIKEYLNKGMSAEEVRTKMMEDHFVPPGESNRVAVAYGMWEPEGGWPDK